MYIYYLASYIDIIIVLPIMVVYSCKTTRHDKSPNNSPMVGIYFGLEMSCVNLDKIHDLPTHPSPTSTIQNNSS